MALFHHSRAFVIALAVMAGVHSTAGAQPSMTLQVKASESDTITLGLSDLDAMQQVVFTTTTIWTDDAVTFSGVPLKAVLDLIDAEGSAVDMVALNDYKVSMPVSEITDTIPIIATRMDGETMPVRDKGPYWVVFPYDQDPSYRTETVHSYSVWQLKRLNIVD